MIPPAPYKSPKQKVGGGKRKKEKSKRKEICQINARGNEKKREGSNREKRTKEKKPKRALM
jgi:hypothetical protein